MANKKQSINWRLLGAALIGFTPFAFANSPINIDSLESAQTGVSFSGDVEAGILNSSLVQGAGIYELGQQTSETSSFTEANLNIKVRPSPETEGAVTIRMHQDWNNYYDEGFNPLLPVWMYFKADLKKYGLKFRVGDIMVNHTSLTLQDQLPDGLLGEAKIFEEKRLNTMADRNVNGLDRHLQGFDLAGDWGTSLKLGGRAIGARLRTPWWNTAVIQYDNAADVGLFGLGDIHVSYKDIVSLGATYSTVNESSSSSRQYYVIHPNFFQGAIAPLTYETSIQNGGYLKFNNPDQSDFLYEGVVEYQRSTYSLGLDSFLIVPDSVKQFDVDYNSEFGVDGFPYSGLKNARNGAKSDQNYINHWSLLDKGTDTTGQFDDVIGEALVAKLSLGYKLADTKTKLHFGYRQVDSNYVSDLAQSQSFINQAPVFNSRNNVKQGNLSVLEGLYQNVYNVRPVTAQSNLETNNPLDLKTYSGTNNNYLTPYDKNNWTNQTSTAIERFAAGTPNLLQLVSPGGEATANRVGFDLGLTSSSEKLGFDFEVKQAIYQSQSSSSLDSSEQFFLGIDSVNSSAFDIEEKKQNFSKTAVGASIDFGKLLNSSSEYSVSLGYTMLGADGFMQLASRDSLGSSFITEIKGAMINAGIYIDLGAGISLLGGLQVLESDYSFTNYTAKKIEKDENDADVVVEPTASEDIVKTIESQYAVGLRYQIAEGATIDAQYTILSNQINEAYVYEQVMPSVLLRMAF